MQLLRWLPRDSALAVSQQGESAVWSVQEHLTATVIDVLNIANWQRGKKAPRPRPIPRPGAEGPRRYGGRHRLTPEQLDAKLEAARRQHGG